MNVEKENQRFTKKSFFLTKTFLKLPVKAIPKLT